jgi:DNA-binding protein HU-beta
MLAGVFHQSMKTRRRRAILNKKELVQAIAGKADMNITQAEKALNGVLDAISETLTKGEKIVLVGFGTFSTNKRPARKGRNPQTGADIEIPEKTVAKFKAGTKLIEQLN